MGEHGPGARMGMIAALGMACIAASIAAPALESPAAPGQGRKSRQGRSHRTTPPPRLDKRERSDSLDRMLRRAKAGGRR